MFGFSARRRGRTLVIRTGRIRQHIIEMPADLSGAPREKYTDLLALLILQAYRDKMLRLQIGASADAPEMQLRYFGVALNGEYTWWDMTPPPVGCYCRR